MGAFGHSCFGSGFILADFKVDGTICLQNRNKLVDICSGRLIGNNNFSADSELAKLAGGNKKSGGGVEV